MRGAECQAISTIVLSCDGSFLVQTRERLIPRSLPDPAERARRSRCCPLSSTRRPVRITSIVVEDARRKRGNPSPLRGINAHASKDVPRA